MKKNTCLKKHFFLPQDHGTWALFLSPLLIGIFSAPRFTRVSLTILIGSTTAFLLRQPLTILVKTLSKRRPRSEQAGAICWVSFYGALGLGTLFYLIRLGYGQMLWMVIPAGFVFAWHLSLISRRAERRQLGAEIVGTGTLALAAAAAYWAGSGSYSPVIWLLWGLVWLQSAASIVYAYLRLEQRTLPERPSGAQNWRMGQRALLYTSFNLALSLVLSLLGQVSPWLWLAFLIQWLETLWGITHPATGQKPTRIGLRQMLVTSLFTLAFILFWR